LQVRHVEMWMPWADGAMLVVEHAHEAFGEIADLARRRAGIRPRDFPGGRKLQVAEIGRVAGTRRRLRHVQA
jgi:hypothetical protein